jgi:hypothetical protein
VTIQNGPVRTGLTCTPSNFGIDVDGVVDPPSCISAVNAISTLSLPEQVVAETIDLIKFAEYLPRRLQEEMVNARRKDPAAIERVRCG